VGDGPLGKKLKERAVELKIDDSVRFLGWQEEVSDFLLITEIFVHPSLQEGLSNALLEAMSFGLPVVATKIGGTVDVIIDGQNGVLVEPGNWRSLADAVLRLIDNRSEAMSLGREALKTIERDYDVKRVHRRYIDLYHRLCSEHVG
jgi:glycosyltransferase involved in cell wall biosynthesis